MFVAWQAGPGLQVGEVNRHNMRRVMGVVGGRGHKSALSVETRLRAVCAPETSFFGLVTHLFGCLSVKICVLL